MFNTFITDLSSHFSNLFRPITTTARNRTNTAEAEAEAERKAAKLAQALSVSSSEVILCIKN